MTVLMHRGKRIEVIKRGIRPSLGLVFSGNQFIDTGLIGDQNTRVTMDLLMQPLAVGVTRWLFGSRAGWANRSVEIIQQNGDNNGTRSNFIFGNQVWSNTTGFVPIDERFTLDHRRVGVDVNGVRRVTFGTIADFTTPRTMALGGCKTSDSDTVHAGRFLGTIFGCQIYQTETNEGVPVSSLVRDFIPMRQGDKPDNDLGIIRGPLNFRWTTLTFSATPGASVHVRFRWNLVAGATTYNLSIRRRNVTANGAWSAWSDTAWTTANNNDGNIWFGAGWYTAGTEVEVEMRVRAVFPDNSVSAWSEVVEQRFVYYNTDHNFNTNGDWVDTGEQPFGVSAPSNCFWCSVTRRFYQNLGTGTIGITHQ